MINSQIYPRVQEKYLPRLFRIPLRSKAIRSLVEEARQELVVKAVNSGLDSAYFGVEDRRGTDPHLAAARKFSRLDMRAEEARGYGFSFLRLAVSPQAPRHAYHVDALTPSGLDSPQATVRGRNESWRAILNFAYTPRKLVYSTADPNAMQMRNDSGMWVPEHMRDFVSRTVTIPEYDQNTVHGLVFCASHVLHRGVDENSGHFIAAYNRYVLHS